MCDVNCEINLLRLARYHVKYKGLDARLTFMPKTPEASAPTPMPKVAIDTLRSIAIKALRFESRINSATS
jgi:hypothetical protein